MLKVNTKVKNFGSGTEEEDGTDASSLKKGKQSFLFHQLLDEQAFPLSVVRKGIWSYPFVCFLLLLLSYDYLSSTGNSAEEVEVRDQELVRPVHCISSAPNFPMTRRLLRRNLHNCF